MQTKQYNVITQQAKFAIYLHALKVANGIDTTKISACSNFSAIGMVMIIYKD